MATILLQAAGSFLGGFLGPAGAILGGAIGSSAGYFVDQSLFGSQKPLPGNNGSRPMHMVSAEEGAHLPRVYGTVRIAGSIIWMTRPEEKIHKKRRRGKGASKPEKQETSYTVNVAFSLCQGEIAGIRRVWADGKEMDLERCTTRIYRGTHDQLPDPLIEAIQGSGKVPAYRGVAYAVFEELDLSAYGNRIPQIQFEVLRPVDSLCSHVKAVALIPGSTEYGLSTSFVSKQITPGHEVPVNRHVSFALTDLDASLDELKALCPNLEHVSLVVTWFGTDLRAQHCDIKPGVVDDAADHYSHRWSVNNIKRSNAYKISTHEGKPAFGGSPSDESIVKAIKALKKRDLKVTLCPFVMMDIPADNQLPDPYGEKKQASYPWRGRITCDPAPGMPGTADGKNTSRDQIEKFCGYYGGKLRVSEWNYKNFILYLSRIAMDAGGVDSFLLGSEMRGLTTIRDHRGKFPFVDELCSLANILRSVLPMGTRISYGADWSEYFGYHPMDGKGDVFFHLDSLWAHSAIDAIGIHNYMPLSDWQDKDYDGEGIDGFSGPYDKAGLKKMIAGGEGFDWFYESPAARETRKRTPISDGAFQKPWIYRYKDLVSWWSSLHYNRRGGVEEARPTAWIPQSKPIWFTEIGCPAIDKGPNRPNVFIDAKSSESELPYFSNGSRCDLALKRFLAAHLEYWDPASPGFLLHQNPISKVYRKHMVDHRRMYLWAWDSRPFPAFPSNGKLWADSLNWRVGHWLNGRLSHAEGGELIKAVLADHGLPVADVSGVSGAVAGYLVTGISTARQALQPLIDLLGLQVGETPSGLVFADRSVSAKPLKINEIVIQKSLPALEIVRTPDHHLPTTAILSFSDPMNDFQTATVRIRQPGVAGDRQKEIFFQGALEKEEAERLLKDWLRRVWLQRETIDFSVPAMQPGILPGALISLEFFDCQGDFLIEQVEEGLVCRIMASRTLRRPSSGRKMTLPEVRTIPATSVGSALVHFLDLPLMPGEKDPTAQFRIAVWRKPWRSQIIYASPETSGFRERGKITIPSVCGVLLKNLEAGKVTGRLDHSTTVVVKLFDFEFSSVSMLQMLGGANAAAILSANGEWELLQFRFAEETNPGEWQLKDLLRGQCGTEDAMSAGASKDSPFILLDDSVVPAGLGSGEEGLLLNWKILNADANLGESGQEILSVKSTSRALKPLSPVHLKCQKTSKASYVFSWIRRSREDADSWESEDIPLGEENETYRIQIKDKEGKIIFSSFVSTSQYVYSLENAIQDSDKTPFFVQFTVWQKGSRGVTGLPVVREFQLY